MAVGGQNFATHWQEVIRLALIVSLLLAAPDRHAQSDRASLRFVNYSAADGLPSNTVYAVTQDAEGALWIGTRNGLARFDGVRFQNWKEYGRVNALTVDKAGRLWVGSMQGLRVRDSSTPLRSAQNDRRSSAQKDIAGNIRALHTDAEGCVWATVGDTLLLKLSYQDGIREVATAWGW